MALKNSKGMFLDVDSSIVEDNLRFVNNSNEEDFNKIFGPAKDIYPSKTVKPFPGFCVKTREVGTESKIFVNVCTTDAIPSPKNITENDLEEILQSDEPSTFRVPMSIGELRSEKDKKEQTAKVCDFAINPQFFEKIQTSPLFKNFFMTLVFEGLKDKHGIVCVDEKVILQNRKAFGTLQIHRIQQREINEKMDNQRIGNYDRNVKPVIETISSIEIPARIPEYRLFRNKKVPNCLFGEFKFPDVLFAKELTLDIGEDRILIESSSRNYLLDIFVPCLIRQKLCKSNFDKTTKILTVTMPLVGG